MKQVSSRTSSDTPFLVFSRVLIRRKTWLSATVLAFALTGAVYAWVKPPTYELSARLYVGKIAGGEFLEAPAVLSSRLAAKYGEEVADGVRRQRPFLRAAVARAIPGAVDITVEADLPEEAVAFLERVASEIKRRHDDAFQRNLNAMLARIDAISLQESSLKKQFDEISELIEQLKRTNPIQASLLALERGQITAQLTEIGSERPELIRKSTPPESERTEVPASVVPPVSPAPPGKSVILVLFVLAGLGFGIFTALAAEAIGVSRHISGEGVQ